MSLKVSYVEKYKQFLQQNYESIIIPKDFQTAENKQEKLQDVYIDGTDMLEMVTAIFVWMHHASNENQIVVLYHTGEMAYPLFVNISKELSYKELKEEVADQMMQIQNMKKEQREAIKYDDKKWGLAPVVIGKENTYGQLNFTENENGDFEVSCNIMQLKERTAIRYVKQIQHVLQQGFENEEQFVVDMDILTEEELALYHEINCTKVVYPNKNITEMFYETVAKFSNRVALSSVEGSLTYEQLNKKSNQIAHMLIQHGVKQGDYVGIFMKRSIDTVVSLLAILKTGAAYIPIDPDYPANRVQYIIEDSQSTLVLTKETKLTYTGIQELSVYESNTFPDTDIKLPIHLDDIAYMIYTSGSTGNPKGTMLAHRGVVNLCTWMKKHYELTEEDVFAQFPSFSFDASIWELFASLFCGGNLYVLLDEQRLSVDTFADAIYKVKATSILGLATIFLQQVATYLPEEDTYKLNSLKRIAVGGEMLTAEVVRLWRERIGTHVQLNNAYGPTECTITTTAYAIPAELNDNLASIPIGKPADNYRVMILNKNRKLCPIGIPGELYIESVGLAKGYFNKPEKTAEAFISHPFKPNSKIYKTGDIVKLLEDGNIEFLHRKDNQVKIRGHRIELGEIQNTIAKYEKIKEVSVFTKKSAEGSHYLVAFYTTVDGIAISELIHELREQLPDYMVPSKLIYIDELPLTPNKKVDIKKLAELEEDYEPIRLQEYIAPSTESEKKIAEAWAEVLEIQKIGVHDDFFTIGGHSLKVLRILTLLKEDFPHLTIQDFFKEKTVYQLARIQRELKVEEKEVFREYKWIHEPKTIMYPEVIKGSRISNIFLTGATGYLGSHVLYELLQQTSSHIYCLVRPTKDVQQRIIDTLTGYFNDMPNELLARITAVPGDLGEDGLGLNEEEFISIRSNIDAVIHCGADVRHFGDVRQFENVNVQGTRRMLALADEGATFHFISTIGIPIDLAVEQWDTYEKIGDFNYNVQLENVYSDSKLQAENLVREAMKRGMRGNIYRAGNLACHSETGAFQQNIEGNAFYRLIKTMLLVGQAPSVKWKVDFTPIDFASKSIVTYMQDPQIVGETLHICHPYQVEFENFVQLIMECGYDLDVVPLSQYVDTGLKLAKENDVIAELIASQVAGDGAQQSEIVMGTRRTNEWIQKKQVVVPAIDTQFIQKLLAHGKQVGYFPKMDK
ncbi:non-ribosomal peptide synthetase [Bacillus sp. AFS019443]|uniref:non-ribosomal peptide synthetase family protein n=1 Tax=Bacillus sp. AFS019443 TaxID=2034279 RepID=UPI000BF8358B|nr:non-ribosomal peptide synthetase [Bacillus sp. AFS019443]PEU11057.1 peptide synthetase [Bacillus sp. AFS019443]